MNEMTSCSGALLRVAVLAPSRPAASGRLRVIDRFKRFGMPFSRAIELRPDLPPVIPKILPTHRAVRRTLDPHAVLGARNAARVFVPPLPQLRIALDRIAKPLHALAQLRDGRRAWRGEILVEIHARILVAVATSRKQRLLCVDGATL